MGQDLFQTWTIWLCCLNSIMFCDVVAHHKMPFVSDGLLFDMDERNTHWWKPQTSTTPRLMNWFFFDPKTFEHVHFRFVRVAHRLHHSTWLNTCYWNWNIARVNLFHSALALLFKLMPKFCKNLLRMSFGFGCTGTSLRRHDLPLSLKKNFWIHPSCLKTLTPKKSWSSCDIKFKVCFKDSHVSQSL